MGRVIVKFSTKRMGYCLYEVIDELAIGFFEGPHSKPEAERRAYAYNQMIMDDSLINKGDV